MKRQVTWNTVAGLLKNRRYDSHRSGARGVDAARSQGEVALFRLVYLAADESVVGRRYADHSLVIPPPNAGVKGAGSLKTRMQGGEEVR